MEFSTSFGKLLQEMTPWSSSSSQGLLDDPDIKPVIEWLGKSSNKLRWEEVAPHSSVYYAQWQSLRVFDRVLYWLLGKFFNLETAHPPKISSARSTARAQWYTHSWIPWKGQNCGPYWQMYRIGVGTVTCVHKREGPRKTSKHQWGNTSLDPPWSTLL